MSNPLPTNPRLSPTSDPPTPKPRSKAKSKVRPSPQKNAVGIGATLNMTGGFPVGAGGPLQPSIPLPTQLLSIPPLGSVSSPAPPTPTTPGASSSSRVIQSKRARPPSLSREPEAKRTKAGSSTRLPLTPTPASPTTSSRSRPRSRKRSTGSAVTDGATSGDPSTASHVRAAATSAPRPRNSQKRTSRTPAVPPPPIAAPVTVDGMYIMPTVKQTSLSCRLYGREIQSLMHAFGEVRHCMRDVLELVEDATRDTVLRIIHRTAADGEINVRTLAAPICPDPHATNRLMQTLRNRADKDDCDRLIRSIPIRRRRSEELAALGDLNPSSDRNYSESHTFCIYSALNVFRSVMGEPTFSEYIKCRDSFFIEPSWCLPKGRSEASNNRFRDWLGPITKSLSIPDETLLVLGHLALEVVGVITQTALLLRYFNDVTTGNCDPRAKQWFYSRHVLAALNHGIGSGIFIPLTDPHVKALSQDIRSFHMSIVTQLGRWRPHEFSKSPHLLPYHIKEALRRLERGPNLLWGFPPSNLFTTD